MAAVIATSNHGVRYPGRHVAGRKSPEPRLRAKYMGPDYPFDNEAVSHTGLLLLTRARGLPKMYAATHAGQDTPYPFGLEPWNN